MCPARSYLLTSSTNRLDKESCWNHVFHVDFLFFWSPFSFQWKAFMLPVDLRSQLTIYQNKLPFSFVCFFVSICADLYFSICTFLDLYLSQFIFVSLWICLIVRLSNDSLIECLVKESRMCAVDNEIRKQKFSPRSILGEPSGVLGFFRILFELLPETTRNLLENLFYKLPHRLPFGSISTLQFGLWTEALMSLLGRIICAGNWEFQIDNFQIDNRKSTNCKSRMPNREFQIENSKSTISNSQSSVRRESSRCLKQTDCF